MNGLIENFAASLAPVEDLILQDSLEYIAWQVGRQEKEFEFGPSDIIDLRTYLLHLKLSGDSRVILQRKIDSLDRFYEWAFSAGQVSENPFKDADFSRPLLSSAEIQRRQEHLPLEPRERELTGLRALNTVGQELNRAVDVQTVLQVALEAIVQTLGISTAWIFLLPEIYAQLPVRPADPPHDFALFGACGLPPGLESQDRYFLCQPPDCICQQQLRDGNMHRAVNIVECSRLQDASKAGGDNRGLFFHASTPLVSAGRVLGLINVATPEWQLFTAADLQFLSALGSLIAVSIDRAGLFDLARSQQARLAWELEMAREVQAGLMPADLPHIDGYELAASWQSAREVAGDFYDIFQLRDGRWVLLVADVCDKGAPAAMYMAMTRSLIRAAAAQSSSPAQVLQSLHTSYQELSSSHMFVTVFMAVLDPGSGDVVYASAGHEPPLLKHPSGCLEELQPTGALIGVFEDYSIAEHSIRLQPGQALVMYTDGVVDALNPQMLDYGQERFQSLVAAAQPPAESLLEAVLNDLAEFSRGAAQMDDITLLFLSRSFA